MVALQLGSVYSGGVGCSGWTWPGRGGAGVVVVVVRVRFADVWWAGGAGWGSGPAWLLLRLWALTPWWVGSLGVEASIHRTSITAARRAGWDGGWLFGVGLFVGGPFRPSVLSSSSSCYLHRRFGPPPTMVHSSSHSRQQDRPRIAPGSRNDLVSHQVSMSKLADLGWGAKLCV